MIKRKRTHGGEDRKGDALARKARIAEQRLRATSPEAKALPPEEIRSTRAERRALVELQQAHGDGDDRTRRQADERLRRQRDDARERERVRNRRKRKRKEKRLYKQLPAGLVPVHGIIEERAGERPVLRLRPEGAPGSKALIGWQRQNVVEPVMPALAREAAALRTIFDIEPGCDREDADVFKVGPKTVVRKEIADVIRSAATELRKVWIPIALDLVATAIITSIVQARGDMGALFDRPDRSTPPTTAEAIYQALVVECRKVVGLAPPEHVHAGTIEWMLSHLAIGATRGGGRTRRLGAEKMRAILADEKALTRFVAPKHGRQGNPKAV